MYMYVYRWSFCFGSEGEAATTLQWTEVFIPSNAECEQAFFDRGYLVNLRSTVVCAGPESGAYTGSCNGDSGGPLSVRSAADGRFEVVGIVSAGIRCDIRGLYTRVTSYIDWITNILNNN